MTYEQRCRFLRLGGSSGGESPTEAAIVLALWIQRQTTFRIVACKNHASFRLKAQDAGIWSDNLAEMASY